MGLNHTAPPDDCKETNSVGSVWVLTHTTWAGVGLWLLRLKLLNPCRYSAPESYLSLKLTASGKALQSNWTGSSNCWGNKRCRQIYQLLHFEHPTDPVHPVPLTAGPVPHSGLPLLGDALKPHTLAQQLILPVLSPILPIWNTDE